ncbi:VanZ like protein [Nitrococcus mobilis Nb-231]|uniref:VanZ like protein n=1 Tax=Nitrococcus mobilis Nb-231 TaxID=314278 RepID=A4BT64_9GAMM|nr:VanZ like protein [Nitrococcus mobilis Nb-231]
MYIESPALDHNAAGTEEHHLHNDKSPKLRLLFASYLILIVYGTLYPLADWRIPATGPVQLLLAPRNDYSLSDIATNYVIYIPAGALFMTVLPGRSLIGRIAAAILLLGGLSLLLEMLQTLLPSRVSSITDTILNTGGAATGALLAPFLLKLLALTGRVQQIRQAHLRNDAIARAATAGLLLWLAAQWSPFVPYVDPYAMWGALEPLRQALNGAELNPQRIVEHTLELTALGMLLNATLRDPYTTAPWLAALLGLGLAGNTLIITQQIYPERVIGIAAAIVLTGVLQGPMNRRRAVTGLVLLGLSMLIGKLWPPFSSGGATFNWILLKGQLLHPLLGIRDLLDDIWPFCALAAFAAGALPRRLDWFTFTVGGLLVVGYAGSLEWAQQWQPHRYPDITDILMAGAGWTIGHISATSLRSALPHKQTRTPRRALARMPHDKKTTVSACNVNETT